MKAITVYPSRREVKLVELDEPAITTPTQVRMRTLQVGVCGTDKEICAFDYGTPPDGSDGLVIGHESLMEIVEIGSGVTGFKPGDLIVPMVRRPCPHDWCDPCRVGRQDFCVSGDFTERGIKQANGYMAEYVVEDQQYLNLVPPALREVAVLVEPLTIAQKALRQVHEIQQRLPWQVRHGEGETRHRAVVLGGGPVGLLGAMSLVAEGFDTCVYSRAADGDSRVALAESIGIKFVHAEATSVEQLAAGIGNIDLVYEAVGASSLAFEVMQVLGTNGIFVFTGVPGRRGPIQVDTDRLMRSLVLKNQVVLGTVNAGRDAFEAAIASLGIFMEKWPVAVRGLITGRYAIEDFADPLSGKAPGIKNVIDFGV